MAEGETLPLFWHPYPTTNHTTVKRELFSIILSFLLTGAEVSQDMAKQNAEDS